MLDFNLIKQAVSRQFARMVKNKQQLFLVSMEGDTLWDVYLKSFPSGTDPLFRERTVHDCQACKHFIRNVGGLVSIQDNRLVSLWDFQIDDPAYQQVVSNMASEVKRHPIQTIFISSSSHIGIEKNFQDTVDGVKTWEHFHLNIPEHYASVQKDDIASRLGDYRATHDVLLRGLSEITIDALETVQELINQNSLYRGQEHAFAVDAFFDLKRKALVADLKGQDLDLFVWSFVADKPISVTRIRNTSIGTLLTDLSEGIELDRAVASFEQKVAPANYKRPTSLVTPRMIEQAKEKLQELNLLSSLERRYATIDDLTINNVLFADRSVKHLNRDVFDELSVIAGRRLTPRLERSTDISIGDFISKVLPSVEKIQLFVENKHIPHFVSLIAPVDPTSPRLFKWDNGFSWSYNGEVTDSLKERVKKAGGNVTGDFCCRLGWYNHDDLDFHMVEPNNEEIYYAHKHSITSNGQLDVDMNAGFRVTRKPVEHIFYKSQKTMEEGVYKLSVHNFCKREAIDTGFEVEVDFLGTTYNFLYEKPVRDQQHIIVMIFEYSRKDGIKIVESLPLQSASKKVWNITTQDYVPVQTLLYSPNYWDGFNSGNKHYFFMLRDCINDGKARGFYNEFLREEMLPHRKVLEIVGGTMQLEPNLHQLSGLGFSSTQRDSIICRVSGKFTRTLNILF